MPRSLSSASLLALACALLFGLSAASPVHAQEEAVVPEEKVEKPADVQGMVDRAIKTIVAMQEGEGTAEWPYEGVYRVPGKGPGAKRGRIIPIGYRIGGTSISALALLESPGFAKDAKRRKAVKKALTFVLKGLKKKEMLVGLNRSRYDVRGWGHTYALLFMLRLQDEEAVPSGMATRTNNAVKWLVKAIQEMAIPKSGGWNYSLRAGFQDPKNSASPFMTGPTLQALFHAKARGHKVSSRIVREAVAALNRGRTDSGGYAYSANPRERASVKGKTEDELSFMDKKGGASGRMCVTEATLFRAGEGDVDRLRDSVATFFKEWDALKVRKQKDGTHIRPYGVAPYYFMYAHFYVAQAIECLPEEERAPNRERLAKILEGEEEEGGGWNDRVFARSRNYGSAMGMMALIMKDIPPTPTWGKAKGSDQKQK